MFVILCYIDTLRQSYKGMLYQRCHTLAMRPPIRRKVVSSDNLSILAVFCVSSMHQPKVLAWLYKHFSFLFNHNPYAVGIVIYIRYRQIKLLILDHSDLIQSTSAIKLSWFSLWVGLGSCLGISIVANFQETNVRIIHFVGAFICFGFGTIYFWIQACRINVC